MYVDNVRSSIDQLEKEEYDDYLNRLRHVLRKRYNKEVKPSELKQRVEEFVNGKNPKIDYFEAYLLTFDEIGANGANNALHNKTLRHPKSWRQLMINVTDDRPLSVDITGHLEDEQIIIELKSLFYNCIGYCHDENKDHFFSNLYYFNNFLKIKLKFV